MIVHVIDYRSSEGSNYLKHPPPKNDVVVWVGQSMSMCDVVSQIKKEVQAAGGGLGSIAVLKIFGHGQPGSMEVGSGLNIDTAGDFYQLQSWMNPNGNGLELHGCNVGAAYVRSNHPAWTFGSYKPRQGERDVGLELIMHFSKILGVAVTAGIDGQYPDSGHNFEGRIRTVFPDWQKLYKAKGGKDVSYELDEESDEGLSASNLAGMADRLDKITDDMPDKRSSDQGITSEDELSNELITNDAGYKSSDLPDDEIDLNDEDELCNAELLTDRQIPPPDLLSDDDEIDVFDDVEDADADRRYPKYTSDDVNPDLSDDDEVPGNQWNNPFSPG